MEIKELEDIIVFRIIDKQDSTTTYVTEKKILEALKKYTNHNIIFNMENVSTVSSAFVRVIISTKRSLYEQENRKDISICCLTKFCENVFDILNIKDLVNIFVTEEESIRYLRNK